jgi:hypothetical protein
MKSHNRPIATGDKPTHTAKENRIQALRAIIALDSSADKREWARIKLAAVLAGDN